MKMRTPESAAPIFRRSVEIRILRKHLVAGVVSAALSLQAWAQYSIAWSTIDGGGGTSTGGVYAISGTIGQPDVGTMSAGPFTLSGGFWSGLIVPSSGDVPALFIKASGDSVIISWSPGSTDFELEAATDLSAPSWSPAPAGNPVMIPASAPARFYRLKKH